MVIDEMASAYKQEVLDKVEYWGEDVDGYKICARYMLATRPATRQLPNLDSAE